MSSILKALKKIDENSQPLQAHPSLPAAIDAKKAVTRVEKKRWLFRRWLQIALIVLVTVAAGVMLLYRQPFFLIRHQPQPAPVASRENRAVFKAKRPAAAAAAAIAGPGGQRPAPMPAKSRAATGALSRLAANNRPAAAAQPPHPAPAASRTNSKAAPAGRKTPVEARAAFNPSAASDKSIPGRRIRTRKKTAVIPAYDRLDNSILKLQALAWSNDASRRLAVINGHVVHEGEAVEGYQVTRIRQEDVVVSDGRKSWRLVFGLQQ